MHARSHQATLDPLAHRRSPEESERFFLARRHADPLSWKGTRAELLSTNGALIRRLSCEPRQIIYQHIPMPDRARRLADRVMGSVHAQSGFLGYSMFQHHDAVALLNMGSTRAPGWMARPHEEGWDELEFSGHEGARQRILAGGQIAWSRRHLKLHAALEQRGASMGEEPIDMLAHVSSWELRALIHSGRSSRPVELLADHATTPPMRAVTSTRLETTFALDSSIYRDLKRVHASLWFVLRFDRALMCLPDEWVTMWLEVQPVEPRGVVI